MFQKIIKGFCIEICLIFSLLFAVEVNDVSTNYQLYNEVQYFMGNSILPTFVDNTFQPKANVNIYQVALIGILINNLTPNYTSQVPYIKSMSAVQKAFPYMQFAFENKYLEQNEAELSIPVETSKAVAVLKKFFPKADLALFASDKELLTREKIMLILKKDSAVASLIAEYEKNVVKKEKKVVGSAVSDFVLGSSSSLDKIELSNYKRVNKTREEAFWELATTRDKEYQLNNEDLSNENLDLLTKRLNKALLYFYDSQFWQTIEECNLILKEDYKHIGALSLKGSAYYMLQNYENAKKYWNRVLYFQPDNGEVKYFIEMLK